MRTLTAFLNDTRIGTLSEGHDLWSFEYDAKWAAAPDSFDLSPRLQRLQLVHRDGGSDRPVQWYFDNLLPEENLREAVSKEANIAGDDAFALLEHLGAESAGSLVLLPPEKDIPEHGGLRALSDENLCERIRNLARATLSSGASKRMSAAGAQNKLLVIYRDNKLYEPTGSEPSTHILKPNHPGDDYPASVINEYLVMNLALKLGLRVPAVFRRYTPEPVYIIERFDRYADDAGLVRRRHVIDACQLLNKSRTFKYRSATLQTLADIVTYCRNRASARLRLYVWLVFNLLIANNDNHLKNLSFMVSSEGTELSPAYDLLSTATYHTRAFAHERANWPAVELAIALPEAPTFGAVRRESVLQAGEALGLTRPICARELDRVARVLPIALHELAATIETENARYPESVRRFLGSERRLIRTIQHLVVPEMIGRVAGDQRESS
ncbi:MAG: HipA domain-containing protein [Steroidobacteraceae bacterium]